MQEYQREVLYRLFERMTPTDLHDVRQLVALDIDANKEWLRENPGVIAEGEQEWLESFLELVNGEYNRTKVLK